ncbi:MAG TPA: hypothetical protein VMW06_11085 [Desulfobacterales bacterium]|nr:hypothetical protein [Desulfobacterales bacterium]
MTAYNYDWAFGFMPYGPVLRARYYAVAASTVINVYHGDIVGVSGAHLLTPKMGYLPGIYSDAVPDSLDNLLGSVQAIFDENMDPVKYIAATEAGNATIAGYVLVADHPDQLYVARENFGTAAIDIVDGSLNADIVSITICAGNSNTGRSRQMINSATVAATAALNMKLYGPHPNDVDLVGDDSPGVSGVEGCRWICKINMHYENMPSVDGGATA